MNQSIDVLLYNAIVLSMDNDFNIFEPGAVAVLGDRIVAVGTEADLQHEFSPKSSINCNGKVLMPGLINAHTHVPMALLRGLADDLRLDVWLLGYVMPVEREFVSPEFVRLGTSLAAAEMIKSGVTCFADMYYFEEEVARATAEVGMRAVCSQTILKFPTPDAQSYEESLESVREFIQRWKGHPLITPSIAPHSPYTCTEEILRATAALAVEFDVPLHTHLAETAQEVENSQNEYGMPVIPYVKEHNIFDAKVISAHCIHIDSSEMHTMRDHGVGVAHCPSSNLKMASGIAPISQMLELGLKVGIGTDGPASNNNLDMFEEIRLAAFLAKGITGDPTTLPARTAIELATCRGASALHLGDVTGSLEAGKLADLILVDLSLLHNAPRFKREANGIYAQLVYAAKASDVTDVMVNGRWLYRDKELLTLDETELLAIAGVHAEHIDAFLIEREQSVLSKLIAIGGALEQESFEVQAKIRISNPDSVLQSLREKDIEILYHRRYHEYDTYFSFADPEQGQLRYREDEYIGEDGQVTKARYRLTMIGQASERHFSGGILLSRSRYLAPATHSLRFYREYFKPDDEIFIEKDRLRWRILFRGTEFYINLDRIDQPDLGTFLEVKSRTWSRLDAEHKAHMAQELIEYLGEPSEKTMAQDYITLLDTIK